MTKQIAFTFILLLSVQSRAQQECSKLFETEKPKIVSRFESDHATANRKNLVKEVLAQFAANKSYAVVPFLDRFPAGTAEATFEYIIEHAAQIEEAEKNGWFIAYRGKGAINDFSLLGKDHDLILNEIRNQANQLIRRSFPDLITSKLKLHAQLRWAHGEKGIVVEEPHPDAGRVDAIIVLLGEGTDIYGPALETAPIESASGEILTRKDLGYWKAVYGNRGPVGQVPQGHLFVFAGRDAEAFGLVPTIHASPLVTKDRLLMVLRYTPD